MQPVTEAQFKAEIAGLRAEILNLKASLVMWLYWIFIAEVFVVLGIVSALKP